MLSIRHQFSMTQVRVAILAVLWENCAKNGLRSLGIAAAIVAIAWVLRQLHYIGPNLFWGAMSGVLAGLLGGLVLLGLLYYVNARSLLPTVRAHSFRQAEFTLSDEGCGVSSEGWTGFLPWRLFVRCARYPQILLLEMAAERPEGEMVESLQRALRATGASTIRSQGRVFPFIWILPIPICTFLTLPIDATKEAHIAYIRKMLKH